jgi:enoyl-CoA hydratase/carnithine racemase
MAEDVLYAKAEGIGTITLNRPSKANTLRVEVIRGIEESLAEAITRRDGSFADYSQGPAEQKPRKRS